jgi:phosphopantothenoylcysteine decarboxylase/phosphopantothenate--cysteine ligase
VTLVTGPVSDVVLSGLPAGVDVVKVETAAEMLAAVRAGLPADVGIFAAAVADWRVAIAAGQKLKKRGKEPPRLELVENPDILKTIATASIDVRPPLVIGFAAETENVVENAKAKRKAKGASWIVANDVSPATGVMGGDRNTVHLLRRDANKADIEVESWPVMSKEEVAEALVARLAEAISAGKQH